MPELPSQPAEGNFTYSALEARLKAIEEHPSDENSRPTVLHTPSPGAQGFNEGHNEEIEYAIRILDDEFS